MELRARPVTEDDMMVIFEWANDPVTREMSFSSEPILLETHKKWFARVLSSPDVHLLIIEGQESGRWHPVGQVRFDADGEISIALAPKFRGRGLGKSLLRTGIEYVIDKLKTKRITAHIKRENLASIKIFERAGFRFHRRTQYKGQKCLEYTYE